MDEDLGVKAPVTRLRRRLSVETDGAQSPATPSTPTKKRGGRLPKPALELINENVTENVSKRATPKSNLRDVAEPADEKASAPVTPSRRSARIRSNTSLIMEPTQSVVDSPRAKRATRRNSLLGSDTETTVTPARQTRRTRKDSTSSVEKLVVTNPNEKVSAQVAEVITEEPEKEVTKDSKPDSQSPTLRKSPRLSQKGRKSIDETVRDISQKREQKDKTPNDSTKLSEETLMNLNGTVLAEELPSKSKDKVEDKLETKESEKSNLSLTSANLINEIDTNPKKSSVFNKTASTIEETKKDKNNRKRTKSWTTNNLSTDNDYVYDKISNKDKSFKNMGAGDSLLKEKIDIKSPNRSAMVFSASMENKENMGFFKSSDMLDSSDTAKFLEKAPSKDMQCMVFLEDSDSNSGSVGSKLSTATTVKIGIMDEQNNGDSHHNDGDDQCVPVVTQTTSKRSSPSESFSIEPMDIDETIPGNVTINDYSDKADSSREEVISNSKRKSSINKDSSIDVTDNSNKSKRTSSMSLEQKGNNSIHTYNTASATEENNNKSKVALNKTDRLSLSDNSQRTASVSLQEKNNEKSNANGNTSKRKSSQSNIDAENNQQNSSISSRAEEHKKINQSMNISKTNESLINQSKMNESINKSKRKSLSETESQNLEKTSNENRSTLVLSQLKDVSTNETNNSSKSPNDINNELSKSDNIQNLAKVTDKTNLSLNYLTSTPLQQKPLQKTMQIINTSIISPNASKNTSKVCESRDTSIKTRKVTKVANNLDSSDDQSEDESRDKSKMIDDEAEEASDDYESGDSRNDEERQYEDDHEVVEKGETLESEGDVSNDSNYEKDSFIVSSDEEDEALLSGSGDDLSMSDKELKMTSKSKKKFDERKRKEQKNASKEMYAARHKLNESNESSKLKSKKSKSLQLESSLLETENEKKDKPIKKNRLRIDSSQDISLNNSDGDTSVCKKKKKTRRLSESVCEDNEKEITMNNQSVSEKNDPLSVSIKKEPKTPQRDLNISTTHITDNIEEVQLDGNISLIKQNETSDPLQTSLAPEGEDSDSDISENMEITASYESVLENLNKIGNKVKMMDTSLNLNKKRKDKGKEPIVDQLNLTQTKKFKKNKAIVVENIAKEPQLSKNKEVSVIISKIDDGDTSDSIDMKLLFSEDSNDSVTNAVKFKAEENQKKKPVEEFIPLKRTEAKTNIRESMDLNSSTNESELNVSKKKNKNRKSIQTNPETENEPEDTNMNFFIDTRGTHEVVFNNGKKDKTNVSMDNSQNECLPEIADKSITVHLQHDVSTKSDKKKKKGKNNDTSVIVELNEEVENVSISGMKKFNKTSNSYDTENINPDTSTTELHDQTLMSDKKKKKKKNRLDVSIQEELITEVVTDSGTHSGKKNKSKRMSESTIECDEGATTSDTLPQEVSFKSDKKKKAKRMRESATDDNILNVNTSVSELLPQEVSFKIDKKKNAKMSESVADDNILDANTTIAELSQRDISSKSDKKKKSKRISSIESTVDNNLNSNTTVSELLPQEVSFKNEKKKKAKRMSESAVDDNILNDNAENAILEEETVNISVKSDKKKKKKKNSQGEISITGEQINEANRNLGDNRKSNPEGTREDKQTQNENTVSEEILLNVSNKSNKKKKKKNKSHDHDTSQIIVNNEGETNEASREVSFKSDKGNKSDVAEPVNDNNTLNINAKKKKNKKNKNKDMTEQTEPEINAVDSQELKVSSKKRKRDMASAPSTDAPDDEILITSDQKKKKRKVSHNDGDDDDSPTEVRISYIGEVRPCDLPPEKTNKAKKNKKAKKKENAQTIEQAEVTSNKSKKRKATENDEGQKKSKVLKENSFDSIHVPRLPESIVNQLDDKPPQESKKQKITKAISTMPFEVEEAKKRKNKPSNYLEQSIYLNDSPVKQKQKTSIKNPKVLPFTPTAITSGKGYTSHFKINVLPQETEFVAQASDISNFRSQYLSNQRIKKLGTFERFKKQRSQKLSKF